MIERLGTWMILRHLVTESAGVFWIWAEILILYAISVAHRTLLTGRISDVQRLSLLLRGRIRWILAALLVASVALLTRHLFLLRWLRENASNPQIRPQEILLPVLARVDQQHIMLWSGFVVLWVLLECAIVWQGWRVYREVRAQLRQSSMA